MLFEKSCTLTRNENYVSEMLYVLILQPVKELTIFYQIHKTKSSCEDNGV